MSIIDLSRSPLSNGELPGRSCTNDRKTRVVARTTRILARPTPSLLSGCGDLLAHHPYITNTTRGDRCQKERVLGHRLALREAQRPLTGLAQPQSDPVNQVRVGLVMKNEGPGNVLESGLQND